MKRYGQALHVPVIIRRDEVEKFQLLCTRAGKNIISINVKYEISFESGPSNGKLRMYL